MNGAADSNEAPTVAVAMGSGVRSAFATRLIALVAALALAATPALAAKPPTLAKPAAKQRFSFDTPIVPFQPPVSDLSKFGFTASGNPATAARLQSVEHAFRFTPSGQIDNHKSLSLGVNTRVIAAANDKSRAAMSVEQLSVLPTTYDVGLSVDWKGFGVNTAFRHFEPGVTALTSSRKDAMDIGVSYRGRNWKTSLQGTAEKGSTLFLSPLERYSVELGGAYLIRPRLSVSGGVRYRLAPLAPSILDDDRADQSVYLGTNIAF